MHIHDLETRSQEPRRQKLYFSTPSRWSFGGGERVKLQHGLMMDQINSMHACSLIQKQSSSNQHWPPSSTKLAMILSLNSQHFPIPHRGMTKPLNPLIYYLSPQIMLAASISHTTKTGQACSCNQQDMASRGRTGVVFGKVYLLMVSCRRRWVRGDEMEGVRQNH